MRRQVMGGVLILAAAGCDDRAATPPPAPRATAPAAGPSPTARPAQGATPVDAQNFAVTAPGELQIDGTGNVYRILLPTDILFDFDGDRLRPAAAPLLGQLKQHLQENATSQIQVFGHTDAKGDDQYNFRLSMRRARAVCDWLKREVRDGFYECIGRGEQEPVRPNTRPDGSDDPLGRQLNRRVELRIVRKVDTKAMLDRARAQAREATEALR